MVLLKTRCCFGKEAPQLNRIPAKKISFLQNFIWSYLITIFIFYKYISNSDTHEKIRFAKNYWSILRWYSIGWKSKDLILLIHWIIFSFPFYSTNQLPKKGLFWLLHLIHENFVAIYCQKYLYYKMTHETTANLLQKYFLKKSFKKI